jgi:hypothetical protein
MTPTLLSAGIARDLLTLRQEFFDLPGLCLTVPQVTRLLDVRSEAAVVILTTLQHEGYLFRSANGAFRRTNSALGAARLSA